MTWQPRDFGIFCAMLPTRLRALDHLGGRVSLPDLGHLTALTELGLDDKCSQDSLCLICLPCVFLLQMGTACPSRAHL